MCANLVEAMEGYFFNFKPIHFPNFAQAVRFLEAKMPYDGEMPTHEILTDCIILAYNQRGITNLFLE